MVILADQSSDYATFTGAFNTLLGWIFWLICAAAVGRLIWIGGHMGYSHNHPNVEPPDSPAIVLVGLVLAGSASGIAAALLTM